MRRRSTTNGAQSKDLQKKKDLGVWRGPMTLNRRACEQRAKATLTARPGTTTDAQKRVTRSGRQQERKETLMRLLRRES